ncbi:MAG TPA: hypothetical protein VJ723_11770, partial [Candidatus Angelobacter sp.]|nr:hypothetical protein [Candidatus Angelobacter sp.]
VVPKCLVCGRNTSAHRFVQVACTVISDDNRPRVQLLSQHVEKHEWSELSGFKDFIGNLDTLVVYAIKGPHPDGIVVLIRDPADLYARIEVYREEIVTSDELAAISSLVSEDEWQEI